MKVTWVASGGSRTTDIKSAIFSAALIVMFNLFTGILQIQMIILEKILGKESGFPLIIGVAKIIRESLEKSCRLKKPV